MEIHIVEDDLDYLKEIKDFLEENGYKVIASESFNIARSRFFECNSDLCIIDIGLPDGSGYDLCKQLRTYFTGPILILTAQDSDEDIIRGLKYGADDYVTKPCSVMVLLSRIEAMLRRNQWDREVDCLFSGDIKIDLVHKSAEKAGINIGLSKLEFELVEKLIKSHGQIMPRELLLDYIWDRREMFIEDNTLSVHVSRLRNKLGRYNGMPYIETVKGIGYRWGVEVGRS